MKKFISIMLILSTLLSLAIICNATLIEDQLIDIPAEEEILPMTSDWCSSYTSVNQMNAMINKGQAPNTIIRADKGYNGQQPHIHFSDGSAINLDGTPHHGNPQPTSVELAWLQKYGWCTDI